MNSPDQRWSTFLKNHAQAIVACDFFTAVTATFRVIDVFVALDIGSRSSDSFQYDRASDSRVDFAEAARSAPGDQEYPFLLHDRHKTSSAGLDEEIERGVSQY